MGRESVVHALDKSPFPSYMALGFIGLTGENSSAIFEEGTISSNVHGTDEFTVKIRAALMRSAVRNFR